MAIWLTWTRKAIYLHVIELSYVNIMNLLFGWAYLLKLVFTMGSFSSIFSSNSSRCHETSPLFTQQFSYWLNNWWKIITRWVVKLPQLFVTKSGVLSCVGRNTDQNITATSVLLRNTVGCHTWTFSFDHAAHLMTWAWTEFLSVTCDSCGNMIVIAVNTVEYHILTVDPIYYLGVI